ncbi:MAG: family 1 glycosylhydrolase, partial [Acidimicrobiia bacterium]|nr:family 1 glycosylhydrolase [Acidimicrobiia bacterium]
DLTFPYGFLWGTATAAHQVEGDNRNSDWWAWENRPGSPVAEPSGAAIEQFTRYADDIELLASLGLNTYRYSIEWARVEPAEGTFDPAALDHYRSVTEAVISAGMVPMVTLNHFTLPVWLGARGGWMSPDAPGLFARYCARVTAALGDLVDWYCTINEPGIVAFGGYLGALDFPPGTTDMASWHSAIVGLRNGHRQGLAAVKETRPEARVGATHSMAEWDPSDAGRPIADYLRHQMEDVFFEVCDDDDFIGVQTYTRIRLDVPAPGRPLVRALTGQDFLKSRLLPSIIRRRSRLGGEGPKGVRTTDMGYEWRPRAVAATVRRVAGVLPGKDIVVTEHGIATTSDPDRIEFIGAGLAALHEVVADGIPLRGYLHWSAFDNFEWALGYRMQFGLIAVDRATQTRTVKPSGTFFGGIARTNRLSA